jgi:hypothetical protein
MTIKEYLKEYLSKSGNVPGTSIEIWEQAVQGKGKLIVEHSIETDKVDIIHTTHNNRTDFYEADNGQDLKSIVEFCMGPVISDNQWKQADSSATHVEDFEFEEAD